MRYTTLGRTGLTVSRLCLGTMNFGPQTSEQDSGRIMDRAHERGISFFDAAIGQAQMTSPGPTPHRPQVLGARRGDSRKRTVYTRVGERFAGQSARVMLGLLGPRYYDGASPN
jgi:aryl-alcohol dehydrogenase-like predicted oxidoreductase